MLAFQGMVSAFPNPEGFSLLLKESIARPDVGSIRGLVRYLGVVRGSVLPWMRGERLPNLESFLLVCMRLGADPLRVAIVPRVELPEESLCRKDGAPFPWPLIRRELTGHRGRYGPGFWARADKKLSALLAESDAGRRSATQVAKALEITGKTLKKYYPTEYARLLDLHEAYRKRERERKFAQRRDKLRAAVLACVREGVYPRQDWVFQRAGFSRHLSCNPEYRQVWLSALSLLQNSERFGASGYRGISRARRIMPGWTCHRGFGARRIRRASASALAFSSTCGRFYPLVVSNEAGIALRSG